MKKNKVRAHCSRCRHEQLFIRAELNHPLHLALTVVTLGLWTVSWAALCIGKLMRPWRCEHCGWHNPEFEGRSSKSARLVRRGPVLDGGRMIAAQSSRLRP
jgi:hypothetical protein